MLQLTAKERAASKKEGWELALVRFRGQFDRFLVLDGQPTGGLTSEVALSQVYKITKDNLKYSVSGFLLDRFTNLSTWRQPLRGSKTGEGTRGPRSQEEYLKGLVRAILPAERVPPLPSGEQIEIFESDTSVDVYSRCKHFPSFRFGVVD